VSLLSIPPGDYCKPALSPNGTQLALQSNSEAGVGDIWVYDLARGSFSRLTFHKGHDWWPVWSPDGPYITFGSSRSGTVQIYRKRADGSGEEEKLTEDLHQRAWPEAWSPDLKTLLFTRMDEENMDLWTVTINEDDDPSSPKVFMQTPSRERAASVSSDGRWLAFMSDESGRYEVYVKSFPKGEGKWQVSTEGGWYPIWNKNTSELFYRNGDKMLVVDYTATDDVFHAEPPRKLFAIPTMDFVMNYAAYDVTPDGNRFFVLIPQDDYDYVTSDHPILVLNWFEELKHLVPTN
jgi:serine/threonine-protein kinase